MAATSAMLVLILLGFHQAAANMHASLVSQSAFGPVSGHGKCAIGPVRISGHCGFRTNVYSGDLRYDTNLVIQLGSMRVSAQTRIIYDPKTGDTTTWKDSSFGNMHMPAMCITKPGGTVAMGAGEHCTGPPVECAQRFLRTLHYEGERHGNDVFARRIDEHRNHGRVEVELNSWTHAIAAEHVSMRGGQNDMHVDWHVTHSHVGAPSWHAFKVPAAWGRCRRFAEVEDMSAEDVSAEDWSPAMPLSFTVLENGFESAELAMALAEEMGGDAQSSHVVAGAGFLLGALSVGAMAMAAAALRRRRCIGRAVNIEP
eukprot:NODE_11252_length_1298_cov_15.479078.p1 GENE.NODE_11252_length_1298_cov_15.479078~~NODE_11252_length_1298_cov_15.479078.p1  ORF type:complete len:313 (-),score=45.61 NODE_11252_length_1298_cov_15.479078:245-1183(-)